ncbi:MAG: hypothetical protein ACM3OO_00725 [Planctomycetaceae bacterium]
MSSNVSASHGTSRYGRLFWSSVAVGWILILVGTWLVISKPGATHPVSLGAWIVGLALFHDVVVAPASLLVARGVHAKVPVIARGLVLGALLVSATITAYALPLIYRRANPTAFVPSLLPRDTLAWLLVVLALVWGVAGALLLARTRRAR